MCSRLSYDAAGHSLGGALATLAAYEFQAELEGIDIQCYTFGAPRTGNAAWARDFMHRVPECWHVINDRAFVRGAFLCLPNPNSPSSSQP